MTASRRDFLKTSALAGFATPLVGFAWPTAPGRAADPAAVPGSLTVTAIAFDGATLLRHATTSEAVQQALAPDVNQHVPGNAVLVGGALPASPSEAVAILERVRLAWPGEPSDDESPGETFALVSGWLLQRAAHEALQPVYAAAADPAEARVYHDAAVLRARTDAAGLSAEDVESFFNHLAHRTFVRYHTLIPDYDDGEGWLDRLGAWRSEWAALARRYGEAYADPDAGALRRYVTEPGLLDGEDPAVRLARRLRAGEAAPAAVADVLGRPQRSLYGQALARGTGHALAAAAFVEGEASREALLDALEG